MNPYLKAKREQYAALAASIEGLQTRAAAENRDLSADELRSVKEQSETAKTLHAEIEMLTEQENRTASVAELGAKLRASDADAKGDQKNRGTALGIKATDRDPGHYRSEKDGGTRSFFADLYRSQQFGDRDAHRRLEEHNRALDTGTEGVGTVAPHWLTEEFMTVARQGRVLANRVRRIPLGNDPRPLTLPKQTTGTDAEIVEQSAENDATEDDDAWDSDVDTVTPKPTTGIQIVSRQMLDMSSPAIDMLIYGDMIAAYDLKLEKKLGAALVTGAGAAVTTFATEAAFNTDLDASDAVLDAAIAVLDARKAPADLLAMSITRYGKFLKLKDADGRPLIPQNAVGSVVNGIGSGTVANQGVIHGLQVVATDGVAVTGTYPESILVVRSADTILFESDVMQFRYEQPLGPESVKLGIWGYTAVLVRRGVKRIVVTAAA